MAYVRGPATSIESSASLLPCNLSVLCPDGRDPEEEPWFCVIHKHIAVLGKLGSTSETQKVVCYGKVEDKNSLLQLTQVRSVDHMHTMIGICGGMIGSLVQIGEWFGPAGSYLLQRVPGI